MRLPALIAAAALVLGSATAVFANYRDTSVPMRTADISVSRYLGKWYEIARFPNRFERGCQGVTAEYGLQEDGNVSVLNTCRKGSATGPASSRGAEARKVGPGQFKVNFVKWLPMAEGDYWVLYVDPGYNLAVVGEPTGRYGWILSRTPQISRTLLDKAYEVLQSNGYDTNQLQLVSQ